MILPHADIWRFNRTINGKGKQQVTLFVVINDLMTYMIQSPAAPQGKGQPRQLGWPFLYRFYGSKIHLYGLFGAPHWQQPNS